jgi:hypothetical protein
MTDAAIHEFPAGPEAERPWGRRPLHLEFCNAFDSPDPPSLAELSYAIRDLAIVAMAAESTALRLFCHENNIAGVNHVIFWLAGALAQKLDE